jgi:hypothetical protein
MVNLIQRSDELIASKAIQPDGAKRIVMAMSPDLGINFRGSLVADRNWVMNETSEWQKKSAGWSKLRSG